MFKRLHRRRLRRILEKYPIPDNDWRAAREGVPLIHGWTASEEARLRDIATLILRLKNIYPAAGFEIDDIVRARVAAMAAVPILHLGIEWYRGWYTIIVYPDEFVPERSWEDEFGVVHVQRHPLSGESWDEGPVLLSLADLDAAPEEPDYNVVIHEMAHKLDLASGSVNGCPPLPPDIPPAAWREAFTAAWDDLERRDAEGAELPMDEYALESPEEFFAVAVETFFGRPDRIAGPWPDLYELLALFFEQTPLERLKAASHRADRQGSKHRRGPRPDSA